LTLFILYTYKEAYKHKSKFFKKIPIYKFPLNIKKLNTLEPEIQAQKNGLLIFGLPAAKRKKTAPIRNCFFIYKESFNQNSQASPLAAASSKLKFHLFKIRLPIFYY